MLSEETNPKHAFAVYLMHWFFVRLNLEYFKLHFGEKKIETLTQFHYGPKSLHVSPKLVQNRVQFSKHHIFINFFSQYYVVCRPPDHNKSKSSLCRDDT